MRRDARRFAHDGDVEMRDHAAAGAHPLAGEGEEAIRRRAAPLRIARRKVLADVAFGERAEDGIHQRMQRDVSIGMPGHAARIWDTDAAEHDVIAVGEGMDVEAVAGAHVGERRHAQRLGAGEIVVGGELHVAGFAVEHAARDARPIRRAPHRR